MDKITMFQEAILSILSEYAQIKYANIQAENKLVADKENHRYQVVTVGWDNDKYIHDCPLHMEIINKKIWIFQNMTEWNVGKMLEDKGVSKQDIVIGFFSESMRAYSEYAVA